MLYINSHDKTIRCTTGNNTPWCEKANAKECMGLTGTHCCCISWVGAGMSKVGAALATFCQSTLCPCTIHPIIPGRTTSRSKESRPGSFNCSQVAQLMTRNCSVSKVPVVITHSAPLSKEKELNTTFQGSIPSYQSYRAFSVIWCCIYMNAHTCGETSHAKTWWLLILAEELHWPCAMVKGVFLSWMPSVYWSWYMNVTSQRITFIAIILPWKSLSG